MPAARTPTSYCRRKLRRGRRRSARSPRGSKSIASSCSFLCKSPAECAADLRWLWEQPRADLPYLGGDGQPPAAARSHQSPGQGRRRGRVKAALFVLASVGLCSTAASAYPTMIRHGYTQCASCHTDPSGGTLLTEYGRAQSQLLLSSRWGRAEDAEASAASKFLFGVLKTPDALTLGGWVREGYIWNVVDGKLVDD